MIKMIIRSYENPEEILEMEVTKYYDCGTYYELEFTDGWGSILKERVIRIEK